jgi:hypothetical protein
MFPPLAFRPFAPLLFRKHQPLSIGSSGEQNPSVFPYSTHILPYIAAFVHRCTLCLYVTPPNFAGNRRARALYDTMNVYCNFLLGAISRVYAG